MKSRFRSGIFLLFLLTLPLSACSDNGTGDSSGSGINSNPAISQATVTSTDQAVMATQIVPTPIPTATQVISAPIPTATQVIPAPIPTATIDQVIPTPIPTIDQVTPTPIPIPAPTVAGINPSSGLIAGGTTVTITGTGFTGTASISFGQTTARNFIVNSDTQITIVSPPGNGTIDITVTTSGGTSAPSLADQFAYI